jgi:hypothetical protein
MEAEVKISGYAGEWSAYLQEYSKIHFDFLQYELGEHLFVIASVLLSRLVTLFNRKTSASQNPKISFVY